MTNRSLLVLLYFVQGLFGVLNQELPEENVFYVDEHTNATFDCTGHNDMMKGVEWIYSEYKKNIIVLENGSLFFTNIVRENSGLYDCILEEDGTSLHKIKIVVVGVPQPPQNVSVHATQVIAIVKWHVHLDEDWENSPQGPKTTVHLHYRPVSSQHWLQVPHHLMPQGQTTIYRLIPNTTYAIELWSSNRYGKSDIVPFYFATMPDVDETEQESMLLLDVEEFSPVVWIIAVLVIVIVIHVLVGFLLFAYWRQRRIGKSDGDDCEVIELVPHIIENPAYQFSRHFDPMQESFLSPSVSSHSAVALV
ncbi:uncharacterized protein LOC119582441 [Penaeus monodon]|uniref:uncharacterized protein LOC119582441 n=1 Tax=Penaeus monodon TaxID=6687 RepID=UPI0018A73FFE|nr:uncharacterized protein LOC119582441 [Penaeus monodon]